MSKDPIKSTKRLLEPSERIDRPILSSRNAESLVCTD
jgi:hypothetical protein